MASLLATIHPQREKEEGFDLTTLIISRTWRSLRRHGSSLLKDCLYSTSSGTLSVGVEVLSYGSVELAAPSFSLHGVASQPKCPCPMQGEALLEIPRATCPTNPDPQGRRVLGGVWPMVHHAVVVPLAQEEVRDAESDGTAHSDVLV